MALEFYKTIKNIIQEFNSKNVTNILIMEQLLNLGYILNQKMKH